MSGPAERQVAINGEPCRIWEKGQGEPLCYLAGLGGLVRWPELLERLAAQRRVIVPSLPGFPGGHGHRKLDDLADWLAATLDLLDAAGLSGADLVGHSVGGALAAEVAALSRASVRKLVLLAPFGLFEESEPTSDVWAKRASELPALYSSQPDAFAQTLTCPEGDDPIEFQLVQTRASEAAARLLWPTGDLGLRKRLHRISAATLLVWGSDDRIVPPSYAKRFAQGIAGETQIRSIAGAGHALPDDAPEATAEAILAFLAR